MGYYEGKSIDELKQIQIDINQKLKDYKGMKLDLNMARGKPCKEQVDLSRSLFDTGNSFPIKTDYLNYGVLDGIDETKEVFKWLFDVSKEELIVGGNSSLTMMYDIIIKSLTFGTVDSDKPWSKNEHVKFLCPVPGYDRHFSMCEAFGIEMINIPMDENGPDMDLVESLVKSDDSIKGIWCVPKYSNPSGVTYSDDVVDRFASMEVAAKDFRIIWDNAYLVHDLNEEKDELKDIFKECKKQGNENRVYMFTSTSKITFPGGGLGFMAASIENLNFIRKQMSVQTIGSNKINQVLHTRFLPSMDAVYEHMKKHAAIVGPKFVIADEIFTKELISDNLAVWNKPNGGYFISLDVVQGCAKEVVALCSDCGVTLTGAGATYPYKLDPEDCNIRIAPTYPPLKELEQAIEILCECIKSVTLNKKINELESLVK